MVVSDLLNAMQYQILQMHCKDKRNRLVKGDLVTAFIRANIWWLRYAGFEYLRI